jgi:hypothetical protein
VLNIERKRCEELDECDAGGSKELEKRGGLEILITTLFPQTAPFQESPDGSLYLKKHLHIWLQGKGHDSAKINTPLQTSITFAKSQAPTIRRYSSEVFP